MSSTTRQYQSLWTQPLADLVRTGDPVAYAEAEGRVGHVKPKNAAILRAAMAEARPPKPKPKRRPARRPESPSQAYTRAANARRKAVLDRRLAELRGKPVSQLGSRDYHSSAYGRAKAYAEAVVPR